MHEKDSSTPSLRIGWTTFGREADAQSCATELVSKGLAFCAQVEGAVQSYYQWDGKLETSQEFPVRIKHLDCNGPQICKWLQKNHPYDTPQWISIKACDYLEEYFLWALQNSKPRSERPK